MLAQTEQNHQVRKGDHQRPAFHHLAEDDGDEQVSGGLDNLGPTERGRSSVDVDESRRCGRLGARPTPSKPGTTCSSGWTS